MAGRKSLMSCRYCGQESTDLFCSQEHEENSTVSVILEKINENLLWTYRANDYPWKVKLTSKSYDALKHRPGTSWVPKAKTYLPARLIYEKDGHEYLVCWENHNIPLVIHARIADRTANFDRLELDDLDRPNILQEHQADFDDFRKNYSFEDRLPI